MPSRSSQLGKRNAPDNGLNPEESDASFQQRACDCVPNRGKEPLAFMVMEYCPSMDLFTYVAELATVGDEALCHALFIQVINTLNFMHETHKMAHLDIKLENIVVDEHYFLRLIDFAYCDRVEARMHISKGTERYFAPEVARIFYQKQVWYPDSLKERPSYIAEKADVFSIGILLFTMFFGTPPFRQNDPQIEPMLHYLCSNDLANAEVFF